MADFISPLDPCPPEAEWRPCPGNGNYEVSEYGHVRRTTSTSSKGRSGSIKKPSLSKGYARYQLLANGLPRWHLAHRLVLTAFDGPAPSAKHECAHRDGVRLNCHHSNLRWATSKENTLDQVRHGTLARGERAPHAKLTRKQVEVIRADARSNLVIAAEYGVSRAAIFLIKRGTNWRDEPSSSSTVIEDQQ